MLETLTESEGMQEMNRLGSEGTPFFFLIDFEKKQPIVSPLSELDSEILCYTINGSSNHENFMPNDESIDFHPKEVPFDSYQERFNKVMEQIQLGNSYLLNLTFPTEIKTNISLKEIYTRAIAPYKLWIKDQLVVFSPEPFVHIVDGKISAHPMKGTIDATIPNAKSSLKNDVKEISEHATIVDLLRNDLNLVATKVQVSQYRYFDKIITSWGALWQNSSKIEGELPADYQNNLGNLIFRLLPAGSISGAPKSKTIEIINAVETYKRGYYTGVFGVFDGQNLYSGIAIRFIERVGERLFFKSGGGITCMSEVGTEYRELSQKVYLPFQNLVNV